MWNARMKLQTLVFAIFLILAGCKPVDGGGEKFLGTWVSLRNPSITLKIEKNGENFLIFETHPAPCWKEKCDLVTEPPMPVQYKDGLLRARGVFGEMTFDIIQSSGYLSGNGELFKRVK
jgi:hypothetical protein